MPNRRAYRCVVNLTLNEVTAPGVRLPSREDVHLSVSLFGQYQTTRLIPSVFPLLVYEQIRFEKTYYSTLNITEVADYLNDELIIFELVQLSEYTDGTVRLASFSSRAAYFLQPFPTSWAECVPADHQILLTRTIAFNGNSPKLSFYTRTLIKESSSPELDALEDALEEEKERRIFLKTHRVPTKRTRSAKSAPSSSHVSVLSYNPNEDDPPPRYRHHTKASHSRCQSVSVPRSIVDIDLSDTTDLRPDFVVRRLKDGLTSRAPGYAQDDRNCNATRKDKNSDESKKSKSTKERKSRKPKETDDLDVEHSSFRHRDKVIHASHHHQPVHVYISDEEDDVYIAHGRPRSISASAWNRPRYRYHPASTMLSAEPSHLYPTY